MEVAQKLIISNTGTRPEFKEPNHHVHWYHIVWFNYDHTKIRNCKDLTWVIYQLEKCPKTDKLHIDGTMWFKNKKRFYALRNQLPGAHIEPCKSDRASIYYSSKIETRIDGPWEHGTPPQQGARNDWKEHCLDYIDNENKFIYEHPEIYVKYHKGFEALKKKIGPKRSKKPEIHYYETMDQAKKWGKYHGPFYVKDLSYWWDGYDGEKCVIIRDLKNSNIDIEALEDDYPYQVPIKNGYKEFLCEHLIYIRSP